VYAVLGAPFLSPPLSLSLSLSYDFLSVVVVGVPKMQQDKVIQKAVVGISYSDFLKFKELEQENERLMKELNEHLKFRSIHEHQKKASVTSETVSPNLEEAVIKTPETETNEKTGAGLTEIETAEIQTPAPEVTSEIKTPIPVANVIPDFQSFFNQFNSFIEKYNQTNLQKGAGATDLTTTLAEPVASDVPNVGSAQPSAIQPNLIEHSDSSSNSSIGEGPLTTLTSLDQRLIDSVPTRNQLKAQKLLSALKEHKSNIDFRDDGTVIINGSELPESNIFKLFPQLYKASNLKLDNLRTLVDEIATLGLGKFIFRHYSAGLSPKGKNLIPNRASERQEYESQNHPWYYIG